MALHIDPAVREEFAAFYDFALEQTPPPAQSGAGAAHTLTLEQLDDAALAARVAAVEQPEAVACVIVRACAALTSLAPLAALPNLTCVGVWRCPQLQILWDMAGQPLWGLAFTDCKSLPDLAPLAACADTLHHLLLQGRAWTTPRFPTLAPLPQLHALRTCDLALRKAKHSETIYFETAFPHLEALTITPNLAKYFRRVKN